MELLLCNYCYIPVEALANYYARDKGGGDEGEKYEIWLLN